MGLLGQRLTRVAVKIEGAQSCDGGCGRVPVPGEKTVVIERDGTGVLRLCITCAGELAGRLRDATPK
ncbi:MAG TPA: hypothetical protein VKM54_25125 [Myxococcota bacterium]|nr:hypothetical protein [Myxococcota bacterium]